MTDEFTPDPTTAGTRSDVATPNNPNVSPLFDPNQDPWAPSELGLELFTDLYELTMMRAYFELGMNKRAIFSVFIRKFPARRKFFLACGIESALRDLATLSFRRESLDYLATLDGKFPDPFLRWLEAFRFSGDVRAVREGTPMFPHAPFLEIDAPVAEGQLVETLVMNRIALETAMASKAARVVGAAQGRSVADFGSRRAQGVDAALRGARAFYVAGVAGTSNVLAGRRLSVPVLGTVAHSFIEAFSSESEAFAAFARVFPGTTLLVDTYDTLNGVRRVIALKEKLGDAFDVAAIRIDSGDLAALSKEARVMLDAAGLNEMKIFVSGGINETRIADLLDAGAPIDGFGVGTEMSVSADAPALDIVFKLTEYDGKGRMKNSPGKRTLPGRKQVYRRYDATGAAIGDIVARADETQEGRPLLTPVMRDGALLDGALRPLEETRAYAAHEVAALPDSVRALDQDGPLYPVDVSELLAADEASLLAEIAARRE